MKKCSFQEGEETHEKQQKMHMKKMKTKHSAQKKQRLDSLLSETRTKILPDGNTSLHALDMRERTVTQEDAIKEINAQITYFIKLWRETK